MRTTQQSDVIEQAARGQHVKAYGRNFKPLVAAGSWQISGFHYGKSKCACCGRPILHVLHLKNESHDVSGEFPETIEIGIVCGPKVFTESCVGFYDDPSREWERQHRAWKDYINYVILCVKNEDLWAKVPAELRTTIDAFLAEGYKQQQHSGGWWMVKDAKKRYLRTPRRPEQPPAPRVVFATSRGLIYTSKRQGLIPLHYELQCDLSTGELTLRTEEVVHSTS